MGVNYTLEKNKLPCTLLSLNRTENCILFIYPILTMSQIFLAATTTLSRVCTQRRHLLTAQNWIRRKQKTAQFNTQPPFEDQATQNGSSRISSSKWHFVIAVARVWVIYYLYQMTRAKKSTRVREARLEVTVFQERWSTITSFAQSQHFLIKWVYLTYWLFVWNRHRTISKVKFHVVAS